jgi:hypothetical protein
MNNDGMTREARYDRNIVDAYVYPDNELIGTEEICLYMRCSPIGLHRLIDDFAFPALVRPTDQKLITTKRSIDEWLWIASEATSIRRKETGTTWHERRERKLEGKYALASYWRGRRRYYERRLLKRTALAEQGVEWAVRDIEERRTAKLLERAKQCEAEFAAGRDPRAVPWAVGLRKRD